MQQVKSKNYLFYDFDKLVHAIPVTGWILIEVGRILIVSRTSSGSIGDRDNYIFIGIIIGAENRDVVRGNFIDFNI
jgi:hypothetical protein